MIDDKPKKAGVSQLMSIKLSITKPITGRSPVKEHHRDDAMRLHLKENKPNMSYAHVCMPSSVQTLGEAQLVPI